MSKLLKLKEWLSVPEAAQHLSNLLGEQVTEADVLRLALDGQLRLSVRFVNGTECKVGRIVPIAEAPFKEIPAVNGEGTIKLYGGEILYTNGIESHVAIFDEKIRTLRGVYDLPMIGAEQLDIEHQYQMLTGGVEVTLTTIDGAFVVGQAEQICQLQESFDHNEYQPGSLAALEQLKAKIINKGIEKTEAQNLLNRHQEQRKEYLEYRESRSISLDFYPAGGLPKDAMLVVRTNSLREFEAKIESENKSAESKELPTERRARLRKRVAEERAKGNRAFNKTVAAEEGIDVSRLKQILQKESEKSLTNQWLGLATSSRQAPSKKLKNQY